MQVFRLLIYHSIANIQGSYHFYWRKEVWGKRVQARSHSDTKWHFSLSIQAFSTTHLTILLSYWSVLLDLNF